MATEVVQVQIISLEEIDDIQSLLPSLTLEELARAEKYYHEKDKKRFIVARSLLKKSLAEKLQCRTAEIIFVTNPQGKPLLELPAGESLHFNISHSEDKIAIVISQNVSVGVDIEYNKEIDFLPLAQRFFTPQEAKFIENIDSLAAQRKAFYQLWTGKEALAKMQGLGIYHVLSDINIQLQNPIIIQDPKNILIPPYSLQWLPLFEDYTCALATQCVNFNIEFTNSCSLD